MASPNAPAGCTSIGGQLASRSAATKAANLGAKRHDKTSTVQSRAGAMLRSSGMPQTIRYRFPAQEDGRGKVNARVG